MSFKNKMSKLKSRKSNRKSVEKMAQTMPNSPRKPINHIGFSYPQQQQFTIDKKPFIKHPVLSPPFSNARADKVYFVEERLEDVSKTLRNMVQSPRNKE